MRRRIPVVIGAMLAVLLVAGAFVARGEEDAAAPRKGRPRPQVTFKGSSPFFKVDFDRYTGVVTCVWCHPKATAVWREREVFHRDAYEVLDAKARANPDCVKCHVTAFNRDGVYPLEIDESDRTGRKMGYAFGGDPEVNRHFEGVQCEACHGPNCGNKYGRERLKRGCERCHNDEYPLFEGFDFAEAAKRLPHAAVGADEKIDYDRFAGLDGCFMCHWPNYRTWREFQGPHTRAFEVLDEAGRKDPACLSCHTTGFNREGTYPREGRSGLRGGYEFEGEPEAQARFEGVQCEACHGINCGTYTTVEQIRPRCAGCHSGACGHDKGFDFDRDYAKVKHRAPEGYVADEADRKVLIEWYDLETALETARAFRVPILVLFSNPPDG